MAATLIVAVLAVAYGSAAPALSVAEFAPTAREALEAPPTTAAAESSGRAGARRGSSTTTAVTVPPTTGAQAPGASASATTRVGRARECFGNPPRQTSDPQSPPCLATVFDGDNGGATSTGVTGTEIKVAIPKSPPTTPMVYQPLFEYFNRHYEFYGRRLVPVYTGTASTSTPADARSSAATIGAQGVFAALPDNGMPATFLAELGRQRVVTPVTNRGFLYEDRTLLDPLHPYLWTVYPSMEEMSRTVANFACTALAGRPAKFAGSDLRTATRSFGIIATGAVSLPSTRAIESTLADCGISARTAGILDADFSNGSRAALQAFKSAGITTIICLCHLNRSIDLNTSASSQVGYRPEWLPMSHTAADGYFGNFFAAAAPELFQIIEITPGEKLLPMQARPSFGAILEVDPTFPDNSGNNYQGRDAYQQLAILAAGIQGAGPHLTPDTFGQALLSMQFSNVGAGQPPYWQPRVGFGPGDHSFISDFSVAWWDMRQPALDTGSAAGKGSWCYLDRGARFKGGEFPANTTDYLFAPDAPCQ